MNRIFLLTLKILFCLTTLYSQQELRIERTVSLSDIGFKTDILLQGYNPQQDFYFEVPGDRLDPAGTYVELKLRLSGALGEHTLLNISVNGFPALSVYLHEVGNNPVLRVPLEMFSHETLLPDREFIYEEYLRISVTAEYDVRDLSPGIATSGALWMVIENGSYVNIVSYRDSVDPTIAGFLGQIVGDVLILTPEIPRGDILQGVVWIVGEFKKRSLHSPRAVDFKIGSDDPQRTDLYDYIMISRIDDLSDLTGPFALNIENHTDMTRVREEDGLVILHTDQNKRILYLTGKTDRGVLQAVRGFLKDSTRLSMLGRVSIVSEVDEVIGTSWPDPPYSVTFDRLGYPAISLSGRRGVRRTMTFSGQSLGIAPRNLILYISGTHSEIPEGDNVYVTIYFNNVRAGTVRLDGKGYFENKSVRLPDYLIEAQNTVQFEFVYLPARGREAPEFYLSIDKNSSIRVGRSRPARRPEFAVALESFYYPTALVLSNDVDAESIKKAALLISALDRNVRSKYLYPVVYTSDRMNPEIFDTTNVIGILRGDDAVFDRIDKNLILNPQHTLKIRNVQNREVIFDLTPDRSYAIMQVMRPRRDTFALIATWSGSDGNALLRDFISEYRARPQMLAGDIALYGGRRSVYIFNTAAGFAEVDYSHSETMYSYIRKNRIIIFAVLWTIFIIFVVSIALYARRRSYKSVAIKVP